MELSFQTGGIIYVYGDMDDDGFYMGELGGHRGLVPSNFLQDAPQDYADDHRSGSVEHQGTSSSERQSRPYSFTTPYAFNSLSV